MSNPYYPINGGYNPYGVAPLYSQFPLPFRNTEPASQPPPQMPQRSARFPPPGQLLQPFASPSQPQPARRAPAPPASGAVNLPLRQLLLNEQVMVNLEARGWVIGIVLATVKLASAIAGWGYRIRFTPPGKDSEEVDTFPHHSDSIRLP